ncbi:MAG: hypothetical protein ACE5KE_04575 [Methanosarcinales archaeon]
MGRNPVRAFYWARVNFYHNKKGIPFSDAKAMAEEDVEEKFGIRRG